MSASIISHLFHRRSFFGLLMLLVLTLVAQPVTAAGIFTARKVTLNNENPQGTGVTYTFTLTAQSSTTIKRVEFQFGTSLGSATPPTGMSTISSSLSGTPTGLGSGGTWTADVTSNGIIKINNSSNTGSPSANASVAFSGITNPTNANTYYVRVSSYDTATSGGTLIDQSDIAFPIANSSVTVSSAISETLSFSLSSTSLSLSPSPLTTGSVSTASHTMTIATNASAGWNISGTSSSTTLTKGGNTIPFIANGGTVTAGTAGYGVAYSGASGHPSGDNNPSTIGTVAASSSPTSGATTTATYKAAINGGEAAGTYTSTVSYVATANF